MKSIKLSLFIACQLLISISLYATDTIYYQYWDINSLDLIGRHDVTVFGNPQIESTDIGDAVRFDGDLNSRFSLNQDAS